MRRFSFFALLTAAGVVLAEPPDLDERLRVASEAPEAALAEGALRQAREAKARAEAPDTEPAAAERARRIEDAALTLAERRIARARAEAALHEAHALRERSQRRLEIAREALVHARQPVPTLSGAAPDEAEE
ncbi:MAG: hypothetical protein H6721_28170 [Sandaracinus sp.]|nr:hypothetical protein [Sandaracinus sp.]MCB9636005.1 hypothetical protein [Sandaracinus sp.]